MFMKLSFNNHEDSAGIYKLINHATNKVYIGQTSVSFKNRWGRHRTDLKRGCHANSILQEDYNNLAPNNDDMFEFIILEIIPGRDQERLNAREEYWLGIYWDDQVNCYNYRKYTGVRARWLSTKQRTAASNRAKAWWASLPPDEAAKRKSLSSDRLKRRHVK